MIPLLVESAPNPLIQRILVIDAPLEQQVDRVEKRDRTAKAEVESILKTQISREDRLAAADDVIINQGSIEELIPQVESLHQLYLRLSSNDTMFS